MFGNVSFRASARNLALKLKEIRDSSSPWAPRDDRLDGFFRSLLSAGFLLEAAKAQSNPAQAERPISANLTLSLGERL